MSRVRESKLKGKSYVIPKRLLWDAWLKVKDNGGAAGADGVTIEQFEEDLSGNLYRLWNRMSSGSYFPGPVRAVEIPKKGKRGGVRVLGIPSVVDRVAQAAAAMALEPGVEPIFHEDSYGYRPGRSPVDAVAVCRERCFKKDWVVDLDIRSFFDSVPWDLMLKAVAHHTDQKWIVLYVERWLKAPMQRPDGTLVPRVKGTPQGASVSPLLANVYLHYVLDLWVHQWRTRHARGDVLIVRFADDCAPRTRKEELSRSSVRQMRCCARDEGARLVGLVALRGRAAGGGRKPPQGAPVKSRGAELAETARHRARQVWITKASESEPPMRRRKRIGDIETGVESLPRDESGGCLLIGQVVSGVKVARAWSGLSCGTREPVAPTGWSASGAARSCGRSSQARTPSSGNCEGESSCAGHRGGPSRISVEGSVIGLERRGRVVLAGFQINRRLVGGVG